MSRKEHLTSEGLTKIISIRASMNNGLSDLLKASFPNIKPVPKPKVEFKGISDFNWVTGFVEGEACFLIKAQKKSQAQNLIITLDFSISQHSRDSGLLRNFLKV
jgi:hypothetical protein